MGRRISYANVTATLALFFALSGGAIAAKHYLINSTRQINPKVLKTLKGKTGKTGATGAAGAPGLEGKVGKEGEKGKTGEPGPLLETLPSGKTLRGHYHIELDGVKPASHIGAGYSYQFPLASAPNGHVIAEGGAPTAECPGNVKEPRAAPGNLCVYESANNSDVQSLEIGSESDRFGFGLLLNAKEESTGIWSIGSWAVTAA